MSEHELAQFLAQDLGEMQSEYDRIRRRTREDPGTAGDEGEEVWAKFLRSWLPDDFKIRLKGRILGPDGTAGPQVDLVVLRPGYPARLLDKKLYFSAGVAAAFECKNTLKLSHLDKAWSTAAAINRLSVDSYGGTPLRELVPQIYFGLLVHSSVRLKGAGLRISARLQELVDRTEKMKDNLSVLTVANIATWDVLRLTYDGPGLGSDDFWSARKEIYGQADDTPHSIFQSCVASKETATLAPANPLGSLVANIIGRLSTESRHLEMMSNYFSVAGLGGQMGRPVVFRRYTLGSQVPPELVAQLPWRLENSDRTEWSMGFTF